MPASSLDAVRIAARTGTPLLGVCLGHQVIGAAFGAPVTEAPELMHGMVSQVTHDGSATVRRHPLALRRRALPLAGVGGVDAAR